MFIKIQWKFWFSTLVLWNINRSCVFLGVNSFLIHWMLALVFCLSFFPAPKLENQNYFIESLITVEFPRVNASLRVCFNYSVIRHLLFTFIMICIRGIDKDPKTLFFDWKYIVGFFIRSGIFYCNIQNFWHTWHTPIRVIFHIAVLTRFWILHYSMMKCQIWKRRNDKRRKKMRLCLLP